MTKTLTTASLRKCDVAVFTYQFERTHRKMPRGYGQWGFVDSNVSPARADYFSHVFWFNGSYGDAKRAAVEYFRQRGVYNVEVCD